MFSAQCETLLTLGGQLTVQGAHLPPQTDVFHGGVARNLLKAVSLQHTPHKLRAMAASSKSDTHGEYDDKHLAKHSVNFDGVHVWKL